MKYAVRVDSNTADSTEDPFVVFYVVEATDPDDALMQMDIDSEGVYTQWLYSCIAIPVTSDAMLGDQYDIGMWIEQDKE